MRRLRKRSRKVNCSYSASQDKEGRTTTKPLKVIGSDTFTLIYDAENRLVEVKKNSVSMATFVYDGDGRRVKSVMGSETILFIGGHYEIKNPGSGQTVTKYYFAGASRIAMRKYTIPQSIAVEYMVSINSTRRLGDHLGSTSITTDSSGNKVSEMRYKPWGEVRYSWTAGASTTPAYSLMDYTFTGQFSYMDDPSTTSVTEGFGLMFYNARFYDPYLSRFAQADSIIPGGVQGYDRYAYTSNNPLRYIDPTGHDYCTLINNNNQEDCAAMNNTTSSGGSGGSGGGGGGGGDPGDEGGEDGSLEAAIEHAFYYSPILGGSSSGCNTWILWNGSDFCHQNTYTPQPICLAIFDCSEEEQDYASRFQYPGQGPWNPVVGAENRSVMGGDFVPGSDWYQSFAIRTEIKGSTMTNYTKSTHILYNGQIDRTISGGYVTTNGHGTNKNLFIAAANQYGGPVAFEALDATMLVFTTADQLSGGALVQLMNAIP